MKSVFDKASDAFNLMMATKMERESIKNFKSNSSTYLRIITEKNRKMRKQCKVTKRENKRRSKKKIGRIYNRKSRRFRE